MFHIMFLIKAEKRQSAFKGPLEFHQESVAASVIQAIGTVEFEDGLRMGVLLGGCWYPWGSRTYPRTNTKPPWGCGLVLGWVWLSQGPHLQYKFQFCWGPRMGGIKLQLLCGVRIELAVGSLPYLALARYLSRSLPHATFCVKKGCYKHANPLGLRLNPTRGLPTTGSRIWGPFKQTNKDWLILEDW